MWSMRSLFLLPGYNRQQASRIFGTAVIIWGIPEAMNDVVIARVAEGLREPEGRVEELVMQEEIVSQLRNGATLRSMEAQSGASLLPFDTDVPGQSESRIMLNYACALLWNFGSICSSGCNRCTKI